QTLLMLAPSVIAGYLAAGEPHPYLPISHAGWEAFYSAAPPHALSRLQRVFDAPAAFLASAASAPATLLHGDAWPPNMGALPGKRQHTPNRTILIDWALATAGPATFDPFWLLFAWKRVETRRALLFYRRQLTRHLARRGIALDAGQWQLLLDLGVVRTVMTCGESMGQAVLFARNDAERAQAVSALAWWVNWADSAIQRRGWG
ncbi:MAG TPA: phosphotransferase, partial [Ktedonobacterales bacterium]